MIFSPTFIVHNLIGLLALEPVDLTSTGTPPGVGLGLNPPVFLYGGETMTVGITHLGARTHRVIAHPEAAR